MMKKIKLFLSFLGFFLILTSCGSLKQGLTGSKKNNKDEFLVQKKNPLVQPPDFNNLPVPKSEKTDELETAGGDEVKKLLEDYSLDSEEISSDEDVKSIEESILEKIN